MSAQSKPSIVFCHGIWADGSCFNKLIPSLRADGYETVSAQYNLDTAQSGIDAVIRRSDGSRALRSLSATPTAVP